MPPVLTSSPGRATLALLLVPLFLTQACFVSKGRHDRLLAEYKTCQGEITRCQNEIGRHEAEAARLAQTVQEQEQSYRSALEDLAVLETERDEYTREIGSYKKQLEERAQQINRVSDTYKSLMDHLSQEVDEGKIRIDRGESGLKLNLVDKILFPSGSADLTPKGKEVLSKVGFVLRDIHDRKICIEGHTDNVPLSPRLRKRFPSNWELSVMRAAAVVRYLQESVGIDPRLLSATGFGFYQPLQSNNTEEGRRANRRIEIVLVPLTQQEMQKLYASPEGGNRAGPQPLPVPPASAPPPEAPPAR